MNIEPKKYKLFDTEDLQKIKNIEGYANLIDWIENNPTEFLKSTQAVISKLLFLSQPTISRFTKKLGYDTFHELQIHIAKRYQLVVPKANINLISNTSIARVKLNVLNQYTNLAKMIYNADNNKTLEKLASNIYCADLVIMFGIGSSYNILKYSRKLFYKLGILSICLSSIHDFMDCYNRFSNKKLHFIIFSKHFNHKEILYIDKILSDEGTNYTVLTNNKEAKTKCANIIYLESAQSEKTFFDITIKISFHMILDIIFFYLLEKIDPNNSLIKNAYKKMNTWDN